MLGHVAFYNFLYIRCFVALTQLYVVFTNVKNIQNSMLRQVQGINGTVWFFEPDALHIMIPLLVGNQMLQPL